MSKSAALRLFEEYESIGSVINARIKKANELIDTFLMLADVVSKGARDAEMDKETLETVKTVELPPSDTPDTPELEQQIDALRQLKARMLRQLADMDEALGQIRAFLEYMKTKAGHPIVN